MADSTTHLDLIRGSVLQREVIFNELADALSPATLGARRASGCADLIWQTCFGRHPGSVGATGGLHFQLQPSSTTYIVAARDNGAISQGTTDTNWNDSDNYMRLYKITTDTDEVTSYEDHRQSVGLEII